MWRVETIREGRGAQIAAATPRRRLPQGRDAHGISREGPASRSIQDMLGDFIERAMTNCSTNPASRSMRGWPISSSRGACRGWAGRAGRAVHAAQPRAAGGARRACRARSTSGIAPTVRWRAIRRATKAFLREIGYLVAEPADFRSRPRGSTRRFRRSAGRSSSCRCRNARYALNAANARWGSLYDALYGTDAISRDGELAPGKGFNPARGAAVVARAAQFLDEAFPLTKGSHADVTGYDVVEGRRGVAPLHRRHAGGPTWG